MIPFLLSPFLLYGYFNRRIKIFGKSESTSERSKALSEELQDMEELPSLGKFNSTIMKKTTSKIMVLPKTVSED